MMSGRHKGHHVKGVIEHGFKERSGKQVNPEPRINHREVGIENPERRLSSRMQRGEAGSSGVKKPTHRWCPAGLSKTQQCRLQKLWQAELAEKQAKEECDRWFNEARPMTQCKKAWKAKRIV
jgi:hypothetical protein